MTEGAHVDEERERLLEDFRRDLALARTRRDVSFGTMEKRLERLRRDNEAQAVDAIGSSTSFNNLLKRPLERPPRRTLLRGFLLALDAPPQELAMWERRRQDLERLLLTPQSTPNSEPVEPHESSEPQHQPSDRSDPKIPATGLNGHQDGDDLPAEGALAGSRPASDAEGAPRDGEPPVELTQTATSGQVESTFGSDLSRTRRRPLRVTAGAIVLLAVAAGVAWRVSTKDSISDLQTVSGQARCSSGAEVAGVYISVVDGPASNWAQWTADPADPSHASYATVVPAGAKYAVHVGCGRDGSKWRTDNWSSPISGATHTLICDDQLVVAMGAHYGSCQAS